MHGFCIPDAIGRCPCVRQRRQCTKRCRCFNCRNNARTPDGCRCGVGERNIRSACTDVPGQRRSKCPCYTSGSSCSAEKCKCKGCRNSFGKRTAGKKDVKKKKVHQMYVQSFAIEKETYHGFLEGKQLLH